MWSAVRSQSPWRAAVRTLSCSTTKQAVKTRCNRTLRATQIRQQSSSSSSKNIIKNVKKNEKEAVRSVSTANPTSKSSTPMQAAATQAAYKLKPSETVEKVPPAPRTLPKQTWTVMDGNEAAAYVAYAMSETSFIYPISPASSMGEHMDAWAAAHRNNVLGQPVDVNMMQSEAGAAGALHGAVAAGALTSTFTASQGLLLMIPNMYLLAGELMPTVLHVSARTVSKHALSIFNDHSDVMACRQTGFAMLCSSSVQEVMDQGLVAHLASLKSRIPFLHFFDGGRTSAEVSKIRPIAYEDMATIFPHDALQNHVRNFALNPTKPMIRGTGQRPDIFFQATVAAHKYYQACPDLVEQTMREVESITGRRMELFSYHGSPTAERVAVIMGSASNTMAEAVDYINNQGENVGVVKVHMFRPWSHKHFMAALPPTVKKIAVLDRTREDGASGMPLFLDVNVSVSDAGLDRFITGGQYGLASKEFTPAMCKAVFDNLNTAEPKWQYVIGIDDDVGKTSLTYGKPISAVPTGTKQCVFWGLGSDGTVGASKTAIKTIGLNTEMYGQGHSIYDSHKQDGVTISHVRFGPQEIKAAYAIASDADYISCAHPSYVHKFDMVSPLKKGGIFVLNSPWNTVEEMEKKLPARIKRQIAEKEAQFYNIDAISLSKEIGLGKRINMFMQSCFYDLSGVLPVEEAMDLLKTAIEKQYHHKGPKVVEKNQKAVDVAVHNLKKIDYPLEAWKNIQSGAVKKSKGELSGSNEFVTTVMEPVLALEGDKLPVSAFEPGGYMPVGTTQFEKRGIAPEIPVWIPDKCTQCNYCAIVCPHAVVRPFLLTKDETKAAPEGFESRKAKGGADMAGLNYTIQISSFDCTGCAVCVQSCPDDALYMAPFEDVAEKKAPGWDYAYGLPDKETGEKYTVKGSQFQRPLLEFSGACAGCGETPYMKLATQLFGDRMVVANASGCSSVWGGTATTNPYTVNKEGHGPAWGRSLFEDNAEYGFGMALGTKQRRLRLVEEIRNIVDNKSCSPELQEAFTKWLKYHDDADTCSELSKHISQLLSNQRQVSELDPALESVWRQQDMLTTQSHWIVGGDGWAYDIGFGGLDHVLSRNENVNVLVLDTEMYSNTGGQVSKATQLSTVAKFASSGKRQNKKDLGQAAMLYENVYVASVALGANMNQCVQAFKEAGSYDGTSLIIAYSPCIDWGIEMQFMMDEMKRAVDSGYWTLYRYDPRRQETGQNAFQLDSRKIKTDLKEFLVGQNRFERLVRLNKDTASSLQKSLSEVSLHRHEKFRKLAMDEYEMLEYLKSRLGEEVSTEKSIVLYGSETGNAEGLASVFSNELKRRGVRAPAMAMDDFDFDSIQNYKNVYCVVATCGQGEFPGNCLEFWKQLTDTNLPPDFLSDVNFTVFGLGDSSYVFYNESAKKIDTRFQELGANRILNLGLGDDKDDEKYETQWNEWLPDLWNEITVEEPSKELLPPSYAVTLDTEGSIPTVEGIIAPAGAKSFPMVKNQLLTPEDYDRDIRHYEFDLSSTGFKYSLGDCLAIYPHNDHNEVLEFCDEYGVSPSSVVCLEDTQNRKDPYPSQMTATQLFSEVLDIFGRPSRRFYETLEMVAQNSSEKEELAHIISKEGKDRFKGLAKETVTYADLLKMFPSAKLELPYLIDHVARIKPRLYSIASSSEMFDDMLHLCVVNEDWVTPSGKQRYGMCTRYLRHLSRADKIDDVAGRVNAAGITIPDSHAPPFIMVGLGTGLAPFRAFIQDREVARMRGETIGDMALFFGARHKRTDYTYGDELEAYHSGGKGILTILSNAFSRDQAHKIYVQNRIAEHPEIVYDYLVKQKGYFYLCGPAGNVPPAVRNAVIKAFVDIGGHKQEEAEQMVTDMQIEGRYNVEAW